MQGTPGIIVILGVECERDTENVSHPWGGISYSKRLALFLLLAAHALHLFFAPRGRGRSGGPAVDLRRWLGGALGLLHQPARFLRL